MSDNLSDKNADKKTPAKNQPAIGGVRIVRRIQSHPIWQDDARLKRFLDLLLLARDEDGTTVSLGQRIELKRGHVYRSIRQLQTRWDKSYEWIKAFLKFCSELDMIKATISKHGMDIQIINYDAYNPPDGNKEWLQVLAQSTDTPEVTECPTGTPSEPNQKGISKKESGAVPPPDSFAEIPSEREVGEFCSSFTDLTRGIACIPETWWRHWYGYKVGSGRFPIKWRDAIKNAFIGDFVARHPRALGKKYEEKNGAPDAAPAGVREPGLLRQLIMANKERGLPTADLEAELRRATNFGQ